MHGVVSVSIEAESEKMAMKKLEGYGLEGVEIEVEEGAEAGDITLNGLEELNVYRSLGQGNVTFVRFAAVVEEIEELKELQFERAEPQPETQPRRGNFNQHFREEDIPF